MYCAGSETATTDMRSVVEIVLWNSAIATLLAVVAMVVGRYCRRPSLVYGLWLLVFLKLLTPPLVRIPVAVLSQERTARSPAAPILESPRQSDAPIDGLSDRLDPKYSNALSWDAGASRTTESASNNPASASFSPSTRQAATSADRASPLDKTVQPVNSLSHGTVSEDVTAKPPSGASFPWAALILGSWAAGTLTLFATTLIRLVRFCRHVRRPWPSDDKLQRQADMLAKRFGLSRSPQIKLVNASLPPMLWVMQRSPVIFLPRALVDRLSPEQLLTVLAHELAHYRRHDHWVRWLEVLVVGVYWWHPVAWIARRQLKRSEEECCDAWVLWVLPDAAAVYARTILDTVDFLTADHHPSPVLASGLGPVHVLERRFKMILHTRPAHRGGFLAKCALMLLALVVLPFSARAQREPAATEAAPTLDAPKGRPQNRLPDTNPVPTTELVAPAAAPSTAPAGPGVAPEVPGTAFTPSIGPAVASAAAPSTAGPGVGPVAAPIAVGLPAAGYAAAGSNSMEDRLSRLEKMVQMIVTEMHGQQHSRNIRWTVGNQSSSSNGAGIGSESLSLSDLKKQRIDLEDEMENLKERMDKVDAQIAKLQSARSGNHPASENLQVK
jgi:beta-lactamase regulating signal transducer with metallopeptidase domain